MLLFIYRHKTLWKSSCSFNTSHVTLYRIIKAFLLELLMFQYISCYSLSLFVSFCEIKQDKFQYISCYSLSCYQLSQEVRKILFQYISCYSLSRSCEEVGGDEEVSIHLMLLFIISIKFEDYKKKGFNTSHVTLYRWKV